MRKAGSAGGMKLQSTRWRLRWGEKGTGIPAVAVKADAAAPVAMAVVAPGPAARQARAELSGPLEGEEAMVHAASLAEADAVEGAEARRWERRRWGFLVVFSCGRGADFDGGRTGRRQDVNGVRKMCEAGWMQDSVSPYTMRTRRTSAEPTCDSCYARFFA